MSLREGYDPLSSEQAQSITPVAVRKANERYDPHADAYQPEPGPSPLDEFVSSVKEGATIRLELACKDGRRERIDLNLTESQAWITSPLDDRIAFANKKIRERRAAVALGAAHRLTERDLQPSPQTITPEEEACLREFDALEDVRVPSEDGGYSSGLRLRESFADAGRAPNVEAALRMVLREDFWDAGGDWLGAYGTYTPSPTQSEYLPRGGPAMEQMLISDEWDELAKTRYAWRHDPVAKHLCELIVNFVLGRGVSINCADDDVQAVVDEFLEREKIPQRLHGWGVALIRDGKDYIRKFKIGDGRLKVRKLHPATVWELVTDAEDPLDVYWYVQRFQTRHVMYAQNLPAAQMRWVERTIPAEDMIHVKINADESDVRGLSDLYPALGWMKRLRDYFDAVVQKEYAAAAYQWHYKVKGGQADVNTIANAVSQVPQPGSSFTTNEAVDVVAVSADTKQTSGNGSTYESLINHTALSGGLTKEYFGAASHMSRASALTSTEPAAKTFESRQDVLADLVQQIIQAVIDEADRCGLLNGVEDKSFQVVMPSIIKADASARITLLKLGEAMGWWSKETAANNAAEEADIDNYDFDAEMEKIEKEIGINPKTLIARDAAMVKKGLPSKDDPAFDPGEVPNPDAGATASPASATGAADIRATDGRGANGDKSGHASTEFDTDGPIAEALEEARRRNGIVILP